MNLFCKYLGLSCSFFLLSSSTFAEINIAGKVIDALSRQPLENVNIVVADNTGASTFSDQYGNFNLKVDRGQINLLFSCIGYKTDSIQVSGNATLKVELKSAIVDLKDVVVLQTGNFTRFSTLAKIDLDLKPVRNTQELLRLVPGLFIAQHAGGGKAEQIFLRGFDCDHGTDIQVSMDGIPVNMVSHAHGQGYADAHFIIPETINKIDFGTGPYYASHGNLNTAGYVSFGTYNNLEKSSVQVEAGRYNTFRTLIMIDLLKRNKDKQSAYVAGEFNYTDGPFINKQNFNRFNLFGKYNLEINTRTQLTASLATFKSKWDASGQVPTRAVESGLIDRFGSIDPGEGGNTERYNANVILSQQNEHGNSWINQAYVSRYVFNLCSNFSFYLNDPVNGDEINQAETRILYGYMSTINQKYFFKNWSLQSNYGAGIRYDATTNTKLAHVIKRQFINYVKLGDITEANLYAYIQQQASIGKWIIDAGLRLDYLHFDYLDKLTMQQNPAQGKYTISPKLNIQYTFNQKLQLYVKAGKGFHSNDSRVVTANNGKEILPAAYGGDIGFIVKPTNKLLINIAAWYLGLNQEFVYVGDDGNIEPTGKTKRTGIDLIARYQFSNNLFANLNVNLTKPRALGLKKDENYIPLAPTATSTGGIFYKKKAGLNGGLTYRYLRSRPANEDNSIIAKGYCLIDGTINYTKGNYEIGITFENLLNTKWNEAQFATESRLMNETAAITELNYTPGTPVFARIKFTVFF